MDTLEAPDPWLSHAIDEEKFAFEAILPQQVISGFRTDSDSSGVRALMFAVLEDGIRCFQELSGNRHQHDCREAEVWLLSRDDSAPFSFEHICEEFGISAYKLREVLLDWKARAGPLANRKGQRKRLYRLHSRARRTAPPTASVRA